MKELGVITLNLPLANRHGCQDQFFYIVSQAQLSVKHIHGSTHTEALRLN